MPAKTENAKVSVGDVFQDNDPRKGVRKVRVFYVEVDRALIQTIDGQGIDGTAPKVKVKLTSFFDVKRSKGFTRVTK